MNMAWTNSKNEKRCNVFPSVWGAIVGCTGRGRAWRYCIGHFGRRDVEFACPTCQAATDRLDALRGPAHQEALSALQTAAGVVDYRIAEVKIVAGRPVLTGKVDVHAVEEQVADFAHGMSTAHYAARAILAHGGDCSAMVARHCSRAQRLELVAAYRIAKGVAA